MAEPNEHPRPFRLLTLPPELQVLVYRKYFEGTELTITHYDKQAAEFKFKGMPSLNIELVSRSVHTEARRARIDETHTQLTVLKRNFLMAPY